MPDGGERSAQPQWARAYRDWLAPAGRWSPRPYRLFLLFSLSSRRRLSLPCLTQPSFHAEPIQQKQCQAIKQQSNIVEEYNQAQWLLLVSKRLEGPGAGRPLQSPLPAQVFNRLRRYFYSSECPKHLELCNRRPELLHTTRPPAFDRRSRLDCCLLLSTAVLPTLRLPFYL